MPTAPANTSYFSLELLLFLRGDKPMATQALLSPKEAGRQLLGGGRPLQPSVSTSIDSPRRASFVVRAASTPPMKEQIGNSGLHPNNPSLTWMEASSCNGLTVSLFDRDPRVQAISTIM
ncbi:unnamed protein product [Musa hybrid cultivar]